MRSLYQNDLAKRVLWLITLFLESIMATKKTVTTVNKSAVDGRFVSAKTAKSNPSTTFKQTVVKQTKPKK